MNALLRSIYQQSYFRHHANMQEIADHDRLDSIQCLSSHSARGYEQVGSLKDRLCVPFTLVRDPLERLVSLYNHVTDAEKGHPWYDEVKDFSPEQLFDALLDDCAATQHPFFSSDDRSQVRNCQSRLVAGSSNLGEILEIVRRECLAIAPISRHPHLTEALAVELGWPGNKIHAPIRNVSRHDVTVEMLSAPLRRRLLEANQHDSELYAFADGLKNPIINPVSTLRDR